MTLNYTNLLRKKILSENLFWLFRNIILLNTCCAIVAFFGKKSIEFLYGRLTNHEESTLRKYFRRFVQTKLTFLIFISHHNLLEDILCWTPWLAIQIVCLLILELAELRVANTYNNVSSNVSIRRRVFIASATTNVFAISMIFFVFGIKDYIIFNYTLFLLADCLILLIQSIHLFFKLFILQDLNTQNLIQQQQGSTYYIDFIYGLFRDCLEFANYLHMIFYSHLAITYCCVFLIIQAQYYYGRISSKIRKHWQQREILLHISNSFHEHCLRRWLEQDSSCAVCRKSLSFNLNNLRQHHQQQNNINPIIAGDDVGQAMQMIVEIFSPHNNRIIRWISRFVYDSISEEQVNSMVNQVAEMFPQIPVDQIRQIVNTTGSVSGSVDTLLQQNNPAGPINNVEINQDAQQNAGIQFAEEAASGSDDDDDGSFITNTSEDQEDGQQMTDDEEQQNINQEIPQSSSHLQSSLQPTHMIRPQGFIKTKNEWLNGQMTKMLIDSRRFIFNDVFWIRMTCWVRMNFIKLDCLLISFYNFFF
ncbi:unnamed protein product [Meloidogyne enterolobii]|uniref:Uncharacterized protein n=1 Tax=Meloidogyne enterolobii TaxID=390850 RepID=A0ACB1B413_MELEN